MISGSPEGDLLRRSYTVQIRDAGRMANLPALLIELGLDPARLGNRLRAQGLTVRIRPRNTFGQSAVTRLQADRFPEQMQPPRKPGIGFVLCCSRGELEQAAEHLLSSSQSIDQALGAELDATMRSVFEPLPFSTTIGSRRFLWGQRTYVMGIINVTPDSFSGDGTLHRAWTTDHAVGTAVEQALAFEEMGADILDIGAESTRPGAAPIDAEEELTRLIPALEAIRRATPIPLSVDSYKSAVAHAAIAEGADMVNDVHGMAGDPSMRDTVASARVPVVLMHNRLQARATSEAALGGRYVGVRYVDLVLDVLEELGDLLDCAIGHGIDRRKVVLDPGLGFGKTVEQNLRLVAQGDALLGLGQPVLFGPSRKSFVGYTLGAPPEERIHGTMASIAVAIARGAAHIVRVHDVRAAVETVRIADAVLGTAAPSVGDAAL
ncbi:MAG: dihydropteroate synthase [Anaerolineae bacterium]